MEPSDLPKTERWDEYRRLVLAELERIDRGMASLNTKMDLASDARNKEMNRLWIEITVLKVKASIFGAGCGLVASAIIPLVKFIVSTG